MQRGRDLLRVSEALVETYVDQGQPENLATTSAAQEELASAFTKFDSSRVSLRDLYKSKKSAGWAQRTRGNSRAALAEFEIFLGGMMKLIANDPSVPVEWHKDLADAFEAVGDMRAATGLDAEALSAYEELAALAEKRRSLSEIGVTAYWNWKAAVARENIGDIYRLQGNVGKALEHYLQFESRMDDAVSVDPYNIVWERSDALSHERVGDMRRAVAEAGSHFSQPSSTDAFIEAEEEYQRFLSIIAWTQARDRKNADVCRLKGPSS